MAVQFELYKNPMQEEKKEQVRFHARPVSYQTVETEDLVERIQQSCSLTPADVVATLAALKHEVAQHLKAGKKVHIDGLGYFQVTLNCEEEIKNPKEKRVHKVRLKAIKFKADKELKRELADMEFQRSPNKPHSAVLSNTEIDKKLTKFFAENQILTRKDFQQLCRMTQITAYRHIKRLIEEKKLQNRGTTQQPIYTPVTGNYQISEDLKYNG